MRVFHSKRPGAAGEAGGGIHGGSDKVRRMKSRDVRRNEPALSTFCAVLAPKLNIRRDLRANDRAAEINPRLLCYPNEIVEVSSRYFAAQFCFGVNWSLYGRQLSVYDSARCELPFTVHSYDDKAPPIRIPTARYKTKTRRTKICSKSEKIGSEGTRTRCNLTPPRLAAAKTGTVYANFITACSRPPPPPFPGASPANCRKRPCITQLSACLHRWTAAAARRAPCAVRRLLTLRRDSRTNAISI